MRMLLAIIFAIVFVLPARGQPPAEQVSAEECAEMWKVHDDDEDGFLMGKELELFKAVMAVVDTNNDGKISREEFMTACQRGILKGIKK
jgi:Ca2+-binding EF-hand superfamily protein